MKVVKKFGFLVLLIIITLFVQDASASLLMILPGSSFWEGQVVYDENNFDVLVQYAVYDTQQFPGESAFVDAFNMTGRYVYAYQIFTAEGEYDLIEYFEILDIDGEQIDESLINDDTGFMDDTDYIDFGDPGVQPSSIASEGAWEFAGSVFVPGLHSCFLIFSSHNEPVEGSFTFEIPNDPPPGPKPHTPEPATILLLGLGSMVLFRRRRKSL